MKLPARFRTRRWTFYFAAMTTSPLMALGSDLWPYSLAIATALGVRWVIKGDA